MSSKKHRNSAQPRQPAAPPKYAVGDQVRVKYGTPDPDFPEFPLGGWTGIVTEVDHDTRTYFYMLKWNQFTLDNMHPVFRKRCARDGMDAELNRLSEENLELATGDNLPLEQPAQIVTPPLCPTDQDDRIRAIFGLTSDDPLPESGSETFRQYFACLAVKLRFPFEALYQGATGGFQRGDKHKVTVVGLADPDRYCPEEIGLLFRVQRDPELAQALRAYRRSHGGLFGFLLSLLGRSKSQVPDDGDYLPLSDLDLAKGLAQRQLLEDFDYWMWNY